MNSATTKAQTTTLSPEAQAAYDYLAGQCKATTDRFVADVLAGKARRGMTLDRALRDLASRERRNTQIQHDLFDRFCM